MAQEIIFTATKAQRRGWPGMAININRVMDWCRHSTNKLWVSLKQESVLTPLTGLPWSGIQYSRFSFPHPLIKSTLHSPLMSIIGHTDFEPGLSDRAFQLQLDLRLIRAPTFLGPSEWINPSVLYPALNSYILGKWKIF